MTSALSLIYQSLIWGGNWRNAAPTLKQLSACGFSSSSLISHIITPPLPSHRTNRKGPPSSTTPPPPPTHTHSIYQYGFILAFNAIYNHIHCFKNAIYTERQKKLITLFRATLTKIHCIKINHIWIHISHSTPYEAHLKNKALIVSKNWEKFSELAKGYFSKITETAHWSTSGLSVAYAEPGRQAVSGGFLLTFYDFNAFFSFLTQANLFFPDVLDKEYCSLPVSTYN